MTYEVSFDVTREDAAKIRKIVDRWVRNRLEAGFETDRLSAQMDVTATHANGCPLDLDKLLASLDFDFNHDMAGIARHLDRETGKLGGFFLPRCTRRRA